MCCSRPAQLRPYFLFGFLFSGFCFRFSVSCFLFSVFRFQTSKQTNKRRNEETNKRTNEQTNKRTYLKHQGWLGWLVRLPGLGLSGQASQIQVLAWKVLQKPTYDFSLGNKIEALAWKVLQKLNKSRFSHGRYC